MEIERVNADGIDFPFYVKYFITEIQDSIDENNSDEWEHLEIEFDSDSLRYCYNAFDLIRKTFRKKGYLVPIPAFKRDNAYHFVFTVSKLKTNFDDLPF